MSDSRGSDTVRPPVALGCFFAASVVVVIAGIIAFGIVFLESGADTGEIRLDQAEAYAPGTAEFLGEHNLFLVRLADGSFLALDDLDAANRASQGTRCRVGLANVEASGLGASPQTLRSRMSPEAAGSRAVLRETCFGAVYDLAGIALLEDARNLDRYTVEVTGSGIVVVDRSERTCSVRTGNQWFSPVRC